MNDVRPIIERELPALPGWCTVEKGVRLATLAASLPPVPRCVELGVFGGRSLVAIALGLFAAECGSVDGIDPYTRAAALEGTNAPANDEWWGNLEYEDVARSAQEALYRLGLHDLAKIVRMRSQDVAQYYEDGSIDLLHQDANHSEETSCAEVHLWAPKMTPEGVWVFDDTDWATTQKAQRELEALGFKLIEDYKTWRVYRRAP